MRPLEDVSRRGSGVFAAAVAVTLFLCADRLFGEEDLVLGFRGKSKYEIVVPDAMPDAAVARSVTDAAELLAAAFSANKIALAVKRESDADGAKRHFYLGPTRFAAAHGVEAGKLRGWEYVHKVVGLDVIIAGHDQGDTLAGKRATSKDAVLPCEGTFFGTAEFVYRYAGARFLAPGESGTTFVPASILHVPSDLDVKRGPHFVEHDVRDSTDMFYRANHCRRFRRIWSRWGHQHPSAVPIAEYGKTHPEYFILAGDARQSELTSEGGQLCLSNPEVRELIYRHLLARCDEGFDVVELGQADGYRPCQCKECAALYGVRLSTRPSEGIAYQTDPAWGEKLWIMHRDMALRLAQDRPGKTLMITSYGPTVRPPRTFSEFPPNVVVEMMDSSAESFEAWQAIKVPGGFSAYLYNWGNFHLVGLTPLNTVARIAAQNQRLVAGNVRMVQVNGSPTSGQWGLEGPNIYVYVRLGIDPFGKTADELFNEYLQAAFREAENPMRRFFLNLQKRVELWEIIAKYVQKMGRDPLFALGTLYTPDLIRGLEEDLALAEKTAELSEVKKRLEIVRYEFDYLKHIAWVINAWRNHQARNDAPSLQQLLDAVDARNAFVARVANGDGKYPKRKNPAYLFMSEQGLKYAGRYMDRAPFNWDTARLRAAPERLLNATKSMEIARAERAPQLDSADWSRAEAQTLGPVEGASEDLSAATTFKMLYDAENLYLRVSAEQPAALMKFVRRGRDAELWLQESIVVNLSPTADRSRYYYLAYEPEPASFNDAQHGFITDLYHPRYGWNDESWNGAWTFQTRLLPEKNRWESMAVIPFATLGAATPKAGETWLLNVGRVHFRGTAKKNDRELSVWSGKLNPSRVPGDGTFGKATFQ